MSFLLALVTLVAAEAPVAGPPEKQAAELVRQGAALGERGELGEAIEHFKRAETVFPRAMHACNVGLAYERWQRLPQALIFLERCRARSFDDLPDWVDERIATITAGLKRGQFAPVEVVVEPEGASIAVDRFAPDETVLSPAVLWLPFGPYRLTISARGFQPTEVASRIAARDPQRVNVRLSREPEAPASPVAMPVTIRTRPQGAEIRIDGERVGQTDFAFTLPEGSYRLNVSKEGYAARELDLEVAEGESATVELSLDYTGLSPWWKWSASGLAVVAASVGTWQALAARRDDRAAERRPPRDPEAKELARSSERAALVADIAFGAALLATGGAGYFWFATEL